jgi:disulfide bond formation protein DsbB
MKTASSFLRPYSLLVAWLIALVGTAGSLVAEYGFGLTPCMLCWYQRIFLYPLVIILGVAAFRNDRKARGYVLPLSVLGSCVALYQYLEQKVPALRNAIRCTTGVPCSGHYINWLGFITIPFLSLIGFLAITALLLVRGES